MKEIFSLNGKLNKLEEKWGNHMESTNEEDYKEMERNY
jgi:hypothetical protein